MSRATKHESIRAGRVIDAHVHLLDRQVLDSGEVPITAVDDLELTGVPWNDSIPVGVEAPIISSLLSGPVLGTRIFGGRPPESRWHRIGWSDIVELGTAVKLSVSGEDLDVTWPERWVRDHIIARIPGGRHDPQ